jgi:hypothetical protein
MALSFSKLRSGSQFAMRFAMSSEHHVPPKQIWTFIHSQGDLSDEEQVHLNACDRCLEIFKYCVLSDDFDEVLEQFKGDRRRSA